MFPPLMDLLRMALGYPPAPAAAAGAAGGAKAAASVKAAQAAGRKAAPAAAPVQSGQGDAGLLDAEEQVAVAAMDTLAACLPGSCGNQVGHASCPSALVLSHGVPLHCCPSTACLALPSAHASV